jgi:hypothetical protein
MGEKDQCRLRCGLIWVNILLSNWHFTAHVSRIWATLLEFLYHELGALLIWASHDYIQQTMPQAFKKNLPKYLCNY